MVCDINGLELSKGDVVAPVSGDMKGKVCGLKTEDGEGFVCIRAAHRPYSKGVWYAAEHVQRLAIGKVRTRKGPNGEAEEATGAGTASRPKPNAKSAARSDSTSNGKASAAPARKGAAKSTGRKTTSAKRSSRRAVTTN